MTKGVKFGRVTLILHYFLLRIQEIKKFPPQKLLPFQEHKKSLFGGQKFKRLKYSRQIIDRGKNYRNT